MAQAKQGQTLGFYALIAAAGKSTRMAYEKPKPYCELAGKTVLRQCLETFLAMPKCRGVRVIINPDDAALYHDAVAGLKLLPHAAGDTERKISIYNGLKDFSDISDKDIILIHDAARACVSQTDIRRLLEAMNTADAATLAVPVADSLRRENGAAAGEVIDRSGLWQIQTPQAFRYGIICKAHEEFEDDITATDDTSLVSKLGIEVALVRGSRENIKITYPEDLIMAEKLLSARYSDIRTGQGFDVHAFETQDKHRKLILGGVEIPGYAGLKGHSDADVALHAITDALLGAMGENDIGHHFPPSDQSFKDMDSRVFLERANDLLLARGGRINNLDLTIICEAPKIGPHRDAMKARIADILKLDAARVNVKATTTEKLGFTGRGEGIAAQAVVTIALAV